MFIKYVPSSLLRRCAGGSLSGEMEATSTRVKANRTESSQWRWGYRSTHERYDADDFWNCRRQQQCHRLRSIGFRKWEFNGVGKRDGIGGWIMDRSEERRVGK